MILGQPAEAVALDLKSPVEACVQIFERDGGGQVHKCKGLPRPRSDWQVVTAARAGRSDDRGSSLPECDEYRISRRLGRARESDDSALRRGVPQRVLATHPPDQHSNF